MNDLDIEQRLREQLPRLADLAVVPDDPDFAVTTVRTVDVRRPRRRRVVTLVAVACVVLAVGGIVAADATSDTGHRREPSGVAGEPAGPAVHTLTIVASNFHFDATHYEVPAGITELRLVSDDGVHTLVLDQPQFDYVHLAAPGGPTSVKVDFVEGHTYGIFDPLPGHQQAGEIATISVGPPDSALRTDATTSTTALPVRP
jgi:hypothetical protein